MTSLNRPVVNTHAQYHSTSEPLMTGPAICVTVPVLSLVGLLAPWAGTPIPCTVTQRNGPVSSGYDAYFTYCTTSLLQNLLGEGKSSLRRWVLKQVNVAWMYETTTLPVVIEGKHKPQLVYRMKPFSGANKPGSGEASAEDWQLAAEPVMEPEVPLSNIEHL